MDSLGGYQLVRRLGAGSRSEVWLGSDGAETVAIKVFREHTARESIDAEIEALGRASHRHLLRLDDLAMGPDGRPCLIVQRLSQWNLGRVLTAGLPSDGEAVTILAPLCLAVAELHRVGIAHGRVRGGSVLFDRSGAPILASFGGATMFGPMPERQDGVSVPPARLVEQAEVADDLDGLETLCLSTLRPGSEIVRWLSVSSSRHESTFARELADRLFQSAKPQPVRFSTLVQRSSSSSVPSRMAVSGGGETSDYASKDDTDASADNTESGPDASGGGGRAAARDIASLLHLPESVKNSIAEWFGKADEAGPVTMFVRRIKAALQPVRKPVWIIVALVAVCVIGATALMPPSGDSGASANVGDGDVAEVSSPTTGAHSPHQGASPTTITDDDPLAAASALLEARTACFEVRSVLCLDSVNQQGSAAMQADAAHVRILQQGGAVDGSTLTDVASSGTRHIEVQERLGDSALLLVTFSDDEEATGAFSLLLIKREEGWRIRDLTPITTPQR